jgi:class 3 adenylate cyclase/tetratricopeptide (TPR) repeat protein
LTCPSCGTPNEAARKFCGECGTRLVSGCPACGSANPPTARFCGECGSALAAGEAGSNSAAVSSPAASGAPAPATADPRGPIAERRVVTVLFADLVGFTTLAEGRDPEEVRELLSRYFDLAREIIGRYGGTVEKFIGDAVMAVWGAPTAHEDDAERGVRAALELVGAVGTLGPGVEARAGVLTGEAAVTLGATNQGMVAGDLVNTASRLQSVAAPGTVLVGEPTQRAAASAITFEPGGDQVLKGKESPIPAWRAVRVVAERGGRGRSAGIDAPFVGRDAELRLLKDLFHATARERRARLVSITGQGGIGKSRLAWEFLKYVDGVVERVFWHEGRSPAYGDGVTFWALGEMVRSRCGLLETDDAETTRTKLAETVVRFVPDETERRWIEAALLTLLGVGDGGNAPREELFRAWRTFFERVASEGMVALLFEDLQWADMGLLDFIDHLLEWSRGVPILIITLARPELLERRPDWGAGRRNFLALGLEPLDEPAMRELLDGLVPGLPAASVTSIVRRADGIPLYAVETIRMLVADGRLREVGEHYEPVGELGELAVPETLQALIAARLDTLDPADRSLLQDAAVLGQSFTIDGVAAVSGLDREVLEPRLRALARNELLQQEVDPRSPERGMHRFVQALIREVAYATLAKRDRRSRHLSAARFFESLGDEELAGALAAHYLAAWQAAPDGPEGEAVAAQARISLLAASERASSLGSPEQAIAFLEQALTVTFDPADRAAILERAGQSAAAAARGDAAERFLGEAIELRRDLGDPQAVRRATVLLSRGLLSARRASDALKVIESALATEFDDRDPDAIELMGQLARARFMSEDPAGALEAAEAALKAAEHQALHETIAENLIIKGVILANMGRHVEGSGLVETARSLAADQRLPVVELRAINSLASVLGVREPKATLDLEQEGLELARRIGRRDLEMILLGNAAEDALRVGAWDWVMGQAAYIQELDIPLDARMPVIVNALFIRLIRGEPADDPVTRETIAMLPSVEDADTGVLVDDLAATQAFVDGRWRDAAASWETVADRSGLNAPYALPKAGRALTWIGDADGARRVLARLDSIGIRGRAIDNDVAAIQAGIDAIEGRREEAVAAFRGVLTGYRELGLVWDEALTGIGYVRLVGADDRDGRAAAESAREILSRLGAGPILAILDQSVAERGARAAAATAGSRAATDREAAPAG